MSAEPDMTAVIPCFNHGKFLGECVASLRAQTHARWRAIVVDDASTDGVTPALCDAVADERVLVVHLETNQGRALARNVGVRLAETEAVCSIDADDAIEPTHFEETVPRLLADPKVGIVYTDYRRFGARSDLLRGAPFSERAMYHRRFVWGGGSVFRKSAWEKTPGYRDAFRDGNEDYDLWLSIVEAGYRGQYVPKPLYRYRSHEGSWTSSQQSGGDRLFRTRLLLYEHHRAGFDRHGAGPRFVANAYRDEATRLRDGGDFRGAREQLGRAIAARPFDPMSYLLALRLWRP